jgi:hypothetical protein
MIVKLREGELIELLNDSLWRMRLAPGRKIVSIVENLEKRGSGPGVFIIRFEKVEKEGS